MIVEQIYTDNTLRNFNYIIASEDTKEAIVIDPLRVDLIMAIANSKNYNITKIINTHEHADHTDGNQELVKLTNAKVFCHHNAIDKIPCADSDSGLYKDNIINLGNKDKISNIEIKVLDTPGHTRAHVCLLVKNKNKLAIFSGDTLFNAGAGNCYGGNVDDLYTTFVDILYNLPEDTLIYPGHDYLQNNLEFTLSREPNNQSAKDLLNKIQDQDPHNAMITTMAIEKAINTFFRLDNQDIINLLDIDNNSTIKEVFVALRELRNHW